MEDKSGGETRLKQNMLLSPIDIQASEGSDFNRGALPQKNKNPNPQPTGTRFGSIYLAELKAQNPNPSLSSDSRRLVDPKRIELSTSALRTQRSPS